MTVSPVACQRRRSVAIVSVSPEREVIGHLPVPELMGHLEAEIATELGARTATGDDHG